ncbi:telomeric repeat-binding factor 2-interacting protein 1-like isoform X2 [Anthonomus grandis grandis]|uniref:telomeric repeat-binding factor 2-interacting protein 1-like isoform X2 n=1 Tax=Anthonomus grandis grandis TaxID=2921223 RepID=UPI002164FD24|nr:telomeric repeat-binding factor 2-interacting protein 1-like isoform X2 [Anthonomus grandis grandis]
MGNAEKHLRLPYTVSEERDIIRYIIDNDFASEVGGNTLWQKMEADGVCPERTWQSMKNRFKRSIIADLNRPQYEITPKELNMLKQVWKFQINNTMKPHLKNISQRRSPPQKKISPKNKSNKRWITPICSSSDEERNTRKESERGAEKNKANGGWLNHIISSSDEEKDGRKRSEIGKKSKEEMSSTESVERTRSKGFSAILNIEKSPSSQPELSKAKEPIDKDVEKSQPGVSNIQSTQRKISSRTESGTKVRSKLTSEAIPKHSGDDSSVNNVQTEKEKLQNKESPTDGDSRSNINNGAKNTENQIDQEKQCQGSKQPSITSESSEELSMKTIGKANGYISNIGAHCTRTPQKLGWVGKKLNDESPKRSSRSAAVTEKRSLSENASPRRRRRQKINSQVAKWLTSDEDDDDSVDTDKSNPSTPEQSHTAIILKDLQRQKNVEIKRIKAHELRASQEEQLIKAARDFKKNQRLKINPFAIGAQHFSKLKDVEIRPLWPG